MITVKRISQQDLNEELSILIHNACMDIELNLEYNVVSKYFSGTAAALGVNLLLNEHLAYIITISNEPVGMIMYSEDYIHYMNCKCIIERFLYIRPEYRNYSTVVRLVKESLSLVKELYKEPVVVFAGNILGTHNVQAVYKRVGFIKLGTNLVKEL
jgi:hypothetical protein